MTPKPLYELLPGLKFKPNKWTLAIVEEFYPDEDPYVISVGYDGITGNVAARMSPDEARKLAHWILNLVGA